MNLIHLYVPLFIEYRLLSTGCVICPECKNKMFRVYEFQYTNPVGQKIGLYFYFLWISFSFGSHSCCVGTKFQVSVSGFSPILLPGSGFSSIPPPKVMPFSSPGHPWWGSAGGSPHLLGIRDDETYLSVSACFLGPCFRSWEERILWGWGLWCLCACLGPC